MKFGLVDTIGLATTLVFALPVANYGVWQFLDGNEVFGAAMVVVAVAMVVLPQVFFDPSRILRGLFVGLLPGRLRSGGDAEADVDATEK